MQPRQVSDLVRQDHNTLITPRTTLREAASRLIQSESDLLAVTDDSGELVGVVNESAVVRALLSSPPPGATVEPMITHHAESVRHTAQLNAVMFLFRSSCHTAIPVLDGRNRVCGLLLRRDVMAEMLVEETPAPSRPEETKSVMEPTAEAKEPASSDLPGLSDARGDSGVTRSSNIVRIENHPDAPNDGRQQRPHFLTGKDARKRLKSRGDQYDNMGESPW